MVVLERVNGDLKKKIGTLEKTMTNLKNTNDGLISLIKDLLKQQVNTNSMLKFLYENKYKDMSLFQ